MLSVVEPELVKLEGLNDAVAPVGSPLTLKSTVPVNPVLGVSLTLSVAVPPKTTVCDVGVADREKVATTTRVTVTVLSTVPLLPVIVSE